MNKDITKSGNPTEIKKICEWTGKEFIVDWKHRNQRFIDKDAMYAWRKSQNRENVPCLTCGKMFERYKRILHPRSGKLTQYCSNECNVKSTEKKDKLREWIKDNNPMDKQECRNKIKQSKLERFGTPDYNNSQKQQETMIKKYGVPCIFYLPKYKSNGRRISKFQRRIYEEILKTYPDARLEEYLTDVRRAVDIYIPSIKKVIECHGDYWHCNPTKCSPNYFNKAVHLTAREVWNRDAAKKELLEKNGYEVEVIWEDSNKMFGVA